MTKTNGPVFGLIDCNNFFVSCERLFQPRFQRTPVVVLSNNDGCVVSRSNEAKALNIKMGMPFFKIKDLIKKHNVQVFSSNFALYHSMSDKIMKYLTELVPALEIYSVDEAFLDLSGFENGERDILGRTVVKRISQGTGIPVSLGIGPTKTLAKIANHIAKKEKNHHGTFNILHAEKKVILSAISIEEIWGIGSRWAEQLRILKIENAYQLSQQDPDTFKKRFNKVLASIILELNGIVMHPLETVRKPKKQIMVSRSFGKTVTTMPELTQAIAAHTTQALEKLRRQKSMAKVITVFLQTDRFTGQDSSYHHPVTLKIPMAVDNTERFLKAALQGIQHLYLAGLKYKKSGVIISYISQKEKEQMDIFHPRDLKAERRMVALDKINERIGPGSLRYAIEGFEKPWRMRSLYRSPCYTTCWSELPWVKAY